jgi:hypothetical protein
VGWWDASEASTLFAADTGTTLATTTVGRWEDRSTAGNHVTQSNPSYRPARTGTLNGKSVVTFDGTDDFLSRSAVACSTQWTAFAVCTKTISTSATIILSQQPTSGSLQAQYLRVNSLVAEAIGFAATNSAVTDTGLSVSQGVPSIISSRQNASAIEVYKDGVGNGGTACVQQSVASAVLNISGYGGIPQNAAGGGWQGDVAEIVIYNTALTTAQRASVEAYLATKWGISNVHTPATASSDPVGYWADKSGNGRHAVQATAGNRPLVGTQNGRKALTFDGTDDRLGTYTSALQPSSIFAVAKCTSSGAFPSGRTILGSDTSNQPLAWIEAGRWEFVRWGQNMSGPVAADSTINVLSATNDGTTSALFVNGGGNVTDSGGTFSSGALTVGAATDQQFFVGDICELLAYDRALTTAERQRAERYLAARWGITLAPQVSNADAQDWVNRVYANGGTVSSATAAAVNQFCTDIENAPGGSIRDRFLRLNLFCGSFQGAFVPLYRSASFGGSPLGNATDTNLGSPAFLVGDYSETGTSGGLLGNGSTKYLNTGLSTNDIGITGHVSAYHRGAMSSGALIRQGDLTTTVGLDYSSGLGVVRGFWSGSGTACFALNTGGHYLVTRRSPTDMDTYVNGALTRGDSSVTTNVTATANAIPFYVFALNNNSSPVSFLNTRLQGYSVGLSMTQAQATHFSTIMTALQTALERA